jgi:hypothetical protein
MNPRLFVLTDITSTQAGVREPDDAQSMVRLLHYANEIDLEGLCATSNMGHGQLCRPELIHQVIDAYAKDYPGLKRHGEFPKPEALKQAVHAGQPVAGPKVAVEQSIGQGKATDASQYLIARALLDDPRPLWVAVWGGTADLAQALWTLENDHPKADLDRFYAKVRVHAIADQDSTAAYLRERYPRLFYARRRMAMRGMYRDGDMTLTDADWVTKHVNQSGSTLGKLYPNYHGGDIWSKVQGVKEGDTPSFLSLIANGLCDVTDPAWSPTWSGWGGRLKGEGLRWEDAESPLAKPADKHPTTASVYQWRPAYQPDFAARLQWATQANPPKPPVIQVERSGNTLKASADQKVTWRWWVDLGEAKLANETTPEVTVTPTRGPVHVIAEARNGHGLHRYARVQLK